MKKILGLQDFLLVLFFRAYVCVYIIYIYISLSLNVREQVQCAQFFVLRVSGLPSMTFKVDL